MFKTLLIVGLGGFAGSAARYCCHFMAGKYLPSAFPFGTFTINIAGSLLIGLIAGLAEKGGWLSPEWRFLLATGFCGGFTTFSSFSLENLELLRDGHYGTAGLYIVSSVLFGILAALAGLWIGKLS